MTITIREARECDIPGITTIYNDAVVNTVAVWNFDTVDEENRRSWLADHRKPGTLALVAVGSVEGDEDAAGVGDEGATGAAAGAGAGAGAGVERDAGDAHQSDADATGGEAVLGYATYGEFRGYDGFRDTVENSVYVGSAVRAGGVGTALMNELLIRARDEGKHVMVAAIESGNTASLRLHAKIGFTTVGELPEVGVKCGRRLGMTLMQIILD